MAAVITKKLAFYEDKPGHYPVMEWLESQSEETQARIRNRLTRIELGNMGDCKPLGEGIYELRFFFGPGYRIYFAETGIAEILLLNGGDKHTQGKDIKKAKALWKRHKEIQ